MNIFPVQNINKMKKLISIIILIKIRKKTKKTAPIIPQSKEQKLSISSQYDDIQTPSTSISVQMDPASTFSTIKNNLIIKMIQPMKMLMNY